MSINATSSSSSLSSAAASASSQVSSSSSSDSTKKTSTDSSFKEEMDKVSTQEDKSSEKEVSNVSDKKEQTSSEQNEKNNNDNNQTLEANADYSNFASMSVLDANSMLTNDIIQMMGINATEQTEDVSSGFMNLDYSTNQVSMTESDANFFLNLTQNNDISAQNITAQAQAMLNNGAEAAEVNQNVQISQTLLNAINQAKENNQPLRIDFDQNVSVILRINKDGVISANFIPGDKAVEQYLKNNLSTLKATFEEQDLPYSDLSYSNRGSKQQKEQRRNNGK